MKLRIQLAPTGLVYALGLWVTGVAQAAPPDEGGFAVEEEEEEDEDVAGVEGTVMQAGPAEEGEEGEGEDGADDGEETPPDDGGDWSFEVEDLSEDAEALEADLKEGEVQAKGNNVGTISGIVTDTNGDPIPGAYIEIVGKKYMARTGIDGRFTLAVPPGTYTVVAREELHEAIEQPGVKVAAKGSVTQDFKLKAEGQALVVKVEGDANVEGEAGVMLQRQQEVASSDRMSREEISRSGGGNLANVARFIVGATVVDGRFVFVRGLGHRYGNTLLDGARVPSPEPDLRTVPLDIFPSGALGAVNVQKSFTPDVPGDFAGGSIQLVTREVPRDPTLKLSVGTGANTASTFRPMLTNGPYPLHDFFGFGNLPRGLSDEIPTDEKVFQELDLETFENKFTEEQMEKWGDAMYTDTRIRRGARAPMDAKFGVTAGDSWSVGKRGRFGLLGSADYSNQHRTLRERIRVFGGSGEAGEVNTQEPQVDFSSMKTTFATRWSALGLARWDVTDDHRVEFSSLYSRDAEDETREQRGVAPSVNPAGIGVMNTRLRYIMRSIWYNRLGARHRFPVFNGKHRIQLDYFGSYARALRDDPAIRSMLYTVSDGCDDLRDIEIACDGNLDTSGSGSSAGSQMFMKLVDDNVDGAINLEIPFDQWSGLKTSIKVGGWAEGKWRDFSVRRFDFRVQAGQAPSGTGNVINDSTIGGAQGDADEPFLLRELTRAADNYRASQELYAGYGMLTLPFAPWVRLSGGARVEASTIRVQPYDLFADPDAPPPDCEMSPDRPECLGAQLTTLNVLPSVALIFSPKLPDKLGNMNIRVMGSQTLARPEFRELAPFQFTDFVGGFTVQGNPDLQPTKIWNAEVRWEWFPKPTEVVAVTGFFKQFDDPIEQIVGPTTPPIQSFTNADGAINIGAELELRKGLGFLAPKKSDARRVLDQFALGTNFAYVYSRVRLLPPCYSPDEDGPPENVPNPEDYVERPGCKPQFDAVTTRERPLQGQSPYVFNVFADYDNGNTGTFVRVLFNTFGPRIYAVGTLGFPNISEQPVPGLDVVVSQRIFAIRRSRDGELRHELRFEADATNLLNPAVRRTQGSDDAVNYEVRKGISFGAGLSWSL